MCLFTRFATAHVGPDASSGRAGIARQSCGALLRRTGEGTRHYVIVNTESFS